MTRDSELKSPDVIWKKLRDILKDFDTNNLVLGIQAWFQGFNSTLLTRIAPVTRMPTV